MSNFKNVIGHEQIIQHMSTALKKQKNIPCLYF